MSMTSVLLGVSKFKPPAKRRDAWYHLGDEVVSRAKDVFAAHGESISTNQVAEGMGYVTTSAHNLCSRLVRAGLVERDGYRHNKDGHLAAFWRWK